MGWPGQEKPGPNGVKIMRWITVTSALALIMALTLGCKQQVFMTEPDMEYAHRLGLPGDLSTNPTASNDAGLAERFPKVTTVNDPERKERPISLAECISLALENSGSANGLGGGEQAAKPECTIQDVWATLARWYGCGGETNGPPSALINQSETFGIIEPLPPAKSWIGPPCPLKYDRVHGGIE
jgi:hypothetical protein